MVKGTTRQVIVVHGSSDTSFDQAIFLVKDKIVSNGGVSENALLKEAQQITAAALRHTNWGNILRVLSGSSIVGLIWLLTALL